ncbi:MAG TPA: phage holin family protein [Vicinamibacterales bacterium]|nr:phage holin family protein [Vicinamibacterales bacterium]
MRAENTDDRSLSELVSELVDELGRLMRKEFELAATELTASARTAAAQAVRVAVGAVLVHAGLLVALATAVLVLVKLGVDAWLGGLIVAVATLALGSLLMTLGIRRIRRTQLVPARTIETLKEGLT